MVNPIPNAALKLIVVALLAVSCTGCEREGPAERAGKDIDRAAADVGQTLERVGEDLEDAADKARAKY
jgi:hypothetical protein